MGKGRLGIGTRSECPDFRGSRSDIFYSKRVYQDILRHHEQDRSRTASAESLLLHFKLAVTLCHELAHSAHYARHGRSVPGFAYSNRTIPEEGFDWEESVSGSLPSDESVGWMLKGWPDLTIRDDYRRCRGGLELYGPLPERVARM